MPDDPLSNSALVSPRWDGVTRYRQRTFHSLPHLRLKSQEEALAFVNERGMIHFWPVQGVTLPSLWTAVAGDRPVADAHDDPGHISWDWKDKFLGTRQLYYAKVLRKKATFISLDLLPNFYALSHNYGAPEDDYLTLYEQGCLTLEAKTVFEALLDQGPLDTIALRKAARMTSPASEARFNRALSDLQADFKILPVGISQVGSWHYAFRYDAVHRHFPDLPDQARWVGELDACQALAESVLNSLGAAQVRDLTHLFGWKPAEATNIFTRLAMAGRARYPVQFQDQPGTWALAAHLD